MIRQIRETEHTRSHESRHGAEARDVAVAPLSEHVGIGGIEKESGDPDVGVIAVDANEEAGAGESDEFDAVVEVLCGHDL